MSDIKSATSFNVGDNENDNINDSELLLALFLAKSEPKT